MRETQRGLEPDECYCRDRDREIPDIALEVVITAPAIASGWRASAARLGTWSCYFRLCM